jgi:hypothetical protein
MRDGVFLPHGSGAGQALSNAFHVARARQAAQPGLEDLALGVLSVDEGLVPAILSGLGVSGPALSAAIAGRYRQAG